jgi:hypothetical protein
MNLDKTAGDGKTVDDQNELDMKVAFPIPKYRGSLSDNQDI